MCLPFKKEAKIKKKQKDEDGEMELTFIPDEKTISGKKYQKEAQLPDDNQSDDQVNKDF